MRRAVASFVSLVLISGLLGGCQKAAPPPSAAPVTAPPVAEIPRAPEPLPVGACTPGATAVTLPSDPYGAGYALKPPATAGTAEKPWFMYLTANQMEEWAGGASHIGTISMRKSGTATVDAGRFGLEGALMPAPPASWYETHLVLEGITPLRKELSAIGDDGRLYLDMPPGRPGDSFRLTLKDVLLDDGTTGDVSVTFCRTAPPRVTAVYDGAPVPGGGPFVARLAFTADMLKETVERGLTGPHGKEDRRDGEWISSLKWLDGRTLELTAAQVPPVLKFNLTGAQDLHGLFLTGGVPNIFAGAPPRVLAVDPVTAAETRLADLLPEPDGALLAPDGQSLRVVSRQFAPGWGGPRWTTQLVDLATGKAREIDPQELWVPAHGVVVEREGLDSLLVRRGAEETWLTGFVVGGIDSYLLSPDGKWVAVLERAGAYTSDSYQPVRFVIVSTDGKSRKVLAGEARMWRPGKDGLMLYGPVWSPDSTRIAFTQKSQDSTATLVVADVAAGALKTVAADLPGVRSSFDPVTWSPDGRLIQVGSLVVDAATGKVARQIEGVGLMPFWSPDGQWLLVQREEWGEVTAVNLRTGAGRSLGQGKPLGWRPDGTAVLIRWPGAAHRTVWGI